ncbi:tRNA-binding protein [Sneathiella chungangensis]|uniref:tRNA-binding protein n=1 Tax=Sneathiella chungangensis TaxID=1418234 RepID=A0A845MFH6_9PROT|nr:tRNA-binding protein [Sneathiella chungangensis]MZR22609.1 tRNA-binding protein [Sneathiella chungangensis]
MTKEITIEDFLKVDIRVGRVLEVSEFPEARKPAYKLKIDFGDGIGIRKSSAQITKLYEPGELVGRQVMAVVNFPPRQIGPFMSEVLVLGFSDADGNISLAAPDHDVPIGGRLH